MSLESAIITVDPNRTRLAADLAAGHTDLARTLFARQEAPAPLIRWSPMAYDLRHPLLARFNHLCNEMLQTNGQIQQEDFDFQRFASLHQWMMLLDVEENGTDYRYLHYGKGIAEYFGRDMTGQRTSKFGGHISLFFSALYDAVLRTKERVMSEHEPPRRIFVRSWRRLIVPLFGRNGEVSRIAALNLPDNELRAGLEIIPDPVFVVDEDEAVRFANPAARTLFPQLGAAGRGATLSEHCGLAVGVDATPLELVESGQVENRLCRLQVGETIADDFLVTVSGAIHGAQAFYVVMVRLAAA